MLIVLQPGADARLFARSSRERTLRVAERAGATVVDPAQLEREGDQVAMLVPAGVVVNAWLFRDAATEAAVRRCAMDGRAEPVWLASNAETGVLLGPARRLVPFVHDLAAATAAPRVPVDQDSVLGVTSPSARRHTAWRILQRTAKNTDGWVSRHFNRPLSRPVSYALLAIGLNAGHASAITLIFGIAAAAIAAQPGYLPFLIMGVMFQLASVLDGVDGEMARATLTESEAGARLDTIVDQLTYVACYFGATAGWVREGGGKAALIWTIVIGVSLLVSLARAGRFVRLYGENASFVFIDRSVRRAARDTGLTMLRLAASGFTLLRRDVFAAVFMAVSLTGQRVLVPGLVLFGVLIANATFSFYHRQLVDAAHAERRAA
jgi:phosphatidylglycerophosphate synthase